MDASEASSVEATLGRFLALGLNGLAALWVVAVALSVVADHTRTAELVVIAIQAAVALGIQGYVIWRIAAGWRSLSNPKRVGLTLLGVIVAPIELALGIVGAAAAAVVWLLVAVVGSGAKRSATASSTAGRMRAGETSGPGTGWALPQSTRKKCPECVDGQRPCAACGRSGYRYADGVAVGPCLTCGGSRGTTCGNCYGKGYTS